MDQEKDVIGQFVTQLIEEKGIMEVDEDVLEQMKDDLRDRVENHINATILENIPEEKLEDFNEILDSGSEEEIRNYCNENISNMDELVAQVMVNFRRTYLNS